MNFREAFWLSGGANSFLSSLRRYLRQKGIRFVYQPKQGFDIALLNALTDGLTLDRIKAIHAYGKPVIHRKVGYIVSGSAQMRALQNGVVCGDRLQIEMSQYIHHTIFQSRYSQDTFTGEGFVGKSSLIANGVDTSIFHPFVSRGLWGSGAPTLRPFWDGHTTFRLAIVTWSKDPAKGFDEYLRFDAALEGMRNVEIWFIGRQPPDVRFRNIRYFGARGHRRLAKLLRNCHGCIQMARSETCSNAMLEAINCGLPVIYLNSGSAKELASNYGVEYCGDPATAIATLQMQYSELSQRTLDNPYSIERAAKEYLKLIHEVLGLHG